MRRFTILPHCCKAQSPRWLQADLRTRIFVRTRTSGPSGSGTPQKPSVGRQGSPKDVLGSPERHRPQNARHTPPSVRPTRSGPQTVTGKGQTTIRAVPQNVVIYHAGTGRIVFIGVIRVFTIFMFVVACTVVAPAFFYSPDAPWYAVPAIIVGGAIPMLFVSYTAAPFVSQVHLALPGFAQKSREAMLSYLANVPPTATLSVETMRFFFYPRRTQIALADLVPATSKVRPVSFMNTNPQPVPWYRLRENVHFFAPEKSRPAKRTHKFFPDIWERVFGLVKQNGRQRV